MTTGAKFHHKSPFNPREINHDNIKGHVQEAARQCAADCRFGTRDDREFALFMRGDTIPETDFLLTLAERHWIKVASFVVEVVRVRVDDDGEVSGDGYYKWFDRPEDAIKAWADLKAEYGAHLTQPDMRLVETLT